jgi:hypothetical protein
VQQGQPIKLLAFCILVDTFKSKTYLRHLQVTKLVPEILDSVNTNERSAEHANPLDTAHTAHAETSAEEPETPFGGESLVAHVVEPGPAEDRGESEEQKHAVEQNEPADCSVAVLKQNHSSNQPDRGPLEVELLCGEVCERDAESAKGGIEQAHESVVELFGVGLARLEFEGSIVVCEVARQTDEHFAERRVDIEVELAFEVVGTEFTEAVVRMVRDVFQRAGCKKGKGTY